MGTGLGVARVFVDDGTAIFGFAKCYNVRVAVPDRPVALDSEG
jgi:hypothetical protein